MFPERNVTLGYLGLRFVGVGAPLVAGFFAGGAAFLGATGFSAGFFAGGAAFFGAGAGAGAGFLPGAAAFLAASALAAASALESTFAGSPLVVLVGGGAGLAGGALATGADFTGATSFGFSFFSGAPASFKKALAFLPPGELATNNPN